MPNPPTVLDAMNLLPQTQLLFFYPLFFCARKQARNLARNFFNYQSTLLLRRIAP